MLRPLLLLITINAVFAQTTDDFWIEREIRFNKSMHETIEHADEACMREKLGVDEIKGLKDTALMTRKEAAAMMVCIPVDLFNAKFAEAVEGSKDKFFVDNFECLQRQLTDIRDINTTVYLSGYSETKTRRECDTVIRGNAAQFLKLIKAQYFLITMAKETDAFTIIVAILANGNYTQEVIDRERDVFFGLVKEILNADLENVIKKGDGDKLLQWPCALCV
jgi:hypothetical protein